VSLRIEQGKLLVEPDELKVDLAVLKDIVRELGEVMKKKSDNPTENMDVFIAEELDDEERLSGVVDAFLERDEKEFSRLAEGYSLQPEILYMLLHISLAPFLWKNAGALARKADLDEVPQGECPVCGDLPIMGFLRPEDGLRVLECSLCGSRWGFPRIMCPFCRTIEQSDLKYIFADKDNSRRAYLCNKCKKYIKISTPRGEKDEEFVVPLEDLATAHLDLAAEERGYERGCRTVFS